MGSSYDIGIANWTRQQSCCKISQVVTDNRLCREILGKSLMHVSGKKIYLEAVYFCSEIKDELLGKQK